MRSAPDCVTGYPPERLGQWAEGAQAWMRSSPAKEAFIFLINGAKERAPAAALELLHRLAI